MVNLTKNFKTYAINCYGVKMGNDWNISIFGGDSPHIGAVALGVPRESLEDPTKISSSVSLITVTGHKEDVIVQRLAKLLSKELNSTVVVCCGIHIDNISFEDIISINETIDNLIEEFLLTIK
ncbi:hypothetical protein [Clostridium baratii]|uniref:prenylated flavin chaperone LpdD n=1 Tax=Clostridium baratii TaxID=1561 RepID=UPI0006BAA770|nr:hypothetical protein [Clostridium baratii]